MVDAVALAVVNGTDGELIVADEGLEQFFLSVMHGNE